MRTYVRAMILVLTCTALGIARQIDWSKKALQSERSRTYDALHYRIAIRLDLDQKLFEGETTVSLTSLREGLETCVLDAEEFTVTKVVSDYGESLQFEQTEKELKVRMPRPLKPIDEIRAAFWHALNTGRAPCFPPKPRSTSDK